MTTSIINWSSLSAEERRNALRRPVQQDTATLQDRVRDILRDVRARGDSALLEYTRRFDGVSLATIEVGTAEFAAAETALNAEQRTALDRAIVNVRRFHEAQVGTTLRVETAPGVVCERHFRPIDAVGLYVPAGVAPLPSAAIMLAVPARIAGCPTRIICTPPRSDGTADPAVLTIANVCGVRRGVQGRRRAGDRGDGIWHADHSEGRQDLRPGQRVGDGREASGRERSRRRRPGSARRAFRSAGDCGRNSSGRVRGSRPAGAGRAQRRCTSDTGHDIQRSGGGRRGPDRDADADASVASARCANRSSMLACSWSTRSRLLSKSATRTRLST